MIRSMTGYGRAELLLENKRLEVEIKSFNHRYLEISLRLPAILLPFDIEIRKKIAGSLSRGKIEANIKIDPENSLENAHIFDLNLPLIQNYHALLVKLKENFNLKGDITIEMMAGFKDVFIPSEAAKNIVGIWERIENVLDEAIIALIKMREKEGELICRDLTLRIGTIRSCIDFIMSRAPQVVTEYQKRLINRVKELTDGIAIDEFRCSQEIAIMAEKSDITEENIRLKSHINQFCDTIYREEAVGRKVDFLLQEMVREVNTIGSKSYDVDISRNVVEIKSELAKLREQVQNLE